MHGPMHHETEIYDHRGSIVPVMPEPIFKSSVTMLDLPENWEYLLEHYYDNMNKHHKYGAYLNFMTFATLLMSTIHEDLDTYFE